MEEQVAMRTGRHPDSYLMDGGFATREEITALEQRDVTVYAPVKPPRNKPEHERYEPRYRKWRSGGNGWPPMRPKPSRLTIRLHECPSSA